MAMFKKLTPEEEQEYREWARKNYQRLTPIKGIWHPVVQDECRRMNDEYSEEKMKDNQ